MNTKIRTIDDYLATLPGNIRSVLTKLRAAIKSAAPDAEEGISYGIPVFTLNGPLVFFAAQSRHLSFYVVDKSLLARFANELKEYRVSGTTIRFSPERPLPSSLIKKIVHARIVDTIPVYTPPAPSPFVLPAKLGKPAEHALANAGISNLKHLTKFSETEIARLHGVGPNAMEKLRIALKVKGLKFGKNK